MAAPTDPPRATHTQTPPSTSSDAKKQKRKRNDKETHILHQTTFRKPTWTYFHLSLITPGTAALPPSTTTTTSSSSLDALTVSTLLTHPLTSYLGTTGAAIPLDILHTLGRDAYIRIPRQDARGFRAALSGWVGGCDAGSVPGVNEAGRVNVAWRVVGEGGSLGLLRGSGGEMFEESGVAY